MRIGYLTKSGKHGPTNEDSLHVDVDLGLFIVADGMGGHNAGEVASKIAVDVTAKSVTEGLKASKKAEQAVREAIAYANKSIFAKSLNNPAWEDMGTTMLTAIVINRQVIIGHVGDSRAYLIRSGEIEQLTNDHTFVFEWLKQGFITREQARTHHGRHGLTEALGATDCLEPGVSVRSWRQNACLLLCTDGLTDILEDREILAIVNSASEPQRACDALMSQAIIKGADDDISVILVCH